MGVVREITGAETPGELTISRSRFANYIGRDFLECTIYWGCSFLPRFAHWVPYFGKRAYRWAQVAEIFQGGCLVPAIVIDADRSYVAVFSSLTADGRHPAPVIKVVSEGLNLITSAPVKNGSTFAATSTYVATPASWRLGQWSDFHPIVVDCLVDDPEDCEHAKQRITKDYWDALRISLERLGPIREPGLYHVDLSDLMWTDD